MFLHLLQYVDFPSKDFDNSKIKLTSFLVSIGAKRSFPDTTANLVQTANLAKAASMVKTAILVKTASVV